MTLDRGLAVVLALLLTACAAPVREPPPAELTGTVLEYLQVQGGRETGRWRIFVTPRWVRVDQGTSAGPYWLLDRRRGRWIAVSESGSRRRVTAPALPRAFPWKIRRELSRAVGFVPTGATALHLRYETAGQACLDAVVLPQVPDWVLSGVQAAWLALDKRRPSWSSDVGPCREALSTDPLAGWREGLPLRLWDAAGNGWFLGDHRSNARLPSLIFQ